ncbi:plasmid mobilization relaxosome protein MobC [Lachnoanaerobaculum sp. Marseille-Q4761]|uniref:plasmid mobilization protein n=1 Tax=Lachnoanaerobaculum sp. Marseille-Q4761 TaxID=2819511 RepID=UPI001AA0D1E6|nr:plasmid mobilization relaxosome protein MobC [Lachnoanaerobaculum sp. Marseille-Q4761]MBO1872302.1 plasmid mobilization relaxosome protein MobC [Lachnoanaerobaculum sp. Marseille-Q4761]
MANRVRTHGIYLMLSDDELKVLEKKYRLSGCKTLRQFIMKCILGKDIFVLDMTVFRELSASIGRITGSINQIAKRVNSTTMIYKDDIIDIQELLKKQGKDIYSLRKKLYDLGNLETINTEEI